MKLFAVTQQYEPVDGDGACLMLPNAARGGVRTARRSGLWLYIRTEIYHLTRSDSFEEAWDFFTACQQHGS